jgi:transposase
MKPFIDGEDRAQSTLFPERLDEYIDEDNPVRAVDAFVDELDLGDLGFDGVEPEITGRPSYHPSTLLKIYIYGYLNRIQSSRRLERETQRNVELIWLTGRLMPDFKTIADFRKDNGGAIRRVCARFIELCRGMQLFSDATVAIDGSKFKAVNARDRNFTQHKIQSRLEHLEKAVKNYLDDLDRADRLPASLPEARISHLKEKIAAVREEIGKLNTCARMPGKSRSMHANAFPRRRSSWSVRAGGAELGSRVVKRWPELFYAFVGTGQPVSWHLKIESQERWAREQATASGDQQTLKALTDTASLPESDRRRIIASGKYRMGPSDLEYAKVFDAFVGRPPHPGQGDVADWIAGSQFTFAKLAPIEYSLDVETWGSTSPSHSS